MNGLFWIVASLLVLSLPSIASATDTAVYQCPGPSDTILYTNKEQPDCRSMTLGTLTIAPTRTYFDSAVTPGYNQMRPFPTDWYDLAAPIGSMRNRAIRSRWYGMQNWIDYNASIGSLRNSSETWPSPFGLYGW